MALADTTARRFVTVNKNIGRKNNRRKQRMLH
jgi:hypothetical protein